MDTELTTLRHALVKEKLRSGMAVLYTLELILLAGIAGIAVRSWILFFITFLILMWLSRYLIFSYAMSIFFTLHWTFGIWGMSYFDNGWSIRTIIVTVLTFAVIGWIHWRGMYGVNNIYSR